MLSTSPAPAPERITPCRCRAPFGSSILHTGRQANPQHIHRRRVLHPASFAHPAIFTHSAQLWHSAGRRLHSPPRAAGELTQAVAGLHDSSVLPVSAIHQPLFDLAEGLEAPVQLLYLLTLLGFGVVGAWLVVRQVLVRRDLEEAAKVLGERTRAGDATSEDWFELGVILLRKKLYTQAVKNLDKARRTWDGAPDELAQVYNALGFAYFNMEKNELAVEHYRKAVDLQPGYVTAWNNLGDAYERKSKWDDALKAYEEALSYAPSNKVAKDRSDTVRTRLSSSRSSA